MWHQIETTRVQGGRPRAACGSDRAVATDRETSAVEPGEPDARTPCAHCAAAAQLRRLGELAPPVADELRAAWSDHALAGRRIEEWLGGERPVDLAIDAVMALVHLYEYLEDQRLLATPDPQTGSAVAGGHAPSAGPASQV